jgi:DNA-binding HxlR family transcriptional regulator
MNPENEKSMSEEELFEFYKVLGLTGTVKILLSLADSRKKYKNFNCGSISTINDRLRQLLHLNLIEHHLTREKKREEWYTLTEKGKKVVECLKVLNSTLCEVYHE